MKIGQEFTNEMVDNYGEPFPRYHTKTHGAEAPIVAMERLLNGEIVDIVVCSRDNDGHLPIITKIFTFGREGDLRCIRHCGENDSPAGNKSSTFWGSCYDKSPISARDRVEIASAIARLMGYEESSDHKFWAFLGKRRGV